MDIKIYKEKAELAQSPAFQRIRTYLFEEILSISNSSIEAAEIRGMLKLIRRIDDWVIDYEYQQKKNKEN